MNPALANRTGLGASFKGLGLYLLHDKRDDDDMQVAARDQTHHRVGFVETRNLPTDDGDRAWRLMIGTVSRADELKRLAGIKATGRKLEKPVLHYSLNWHPDERPTKEQMVTAVESSLKALGLEDHEALIVQHTEMEHSHVHIMVNRVHPETGVAAKLSNSRLVLDKWADQFERANDNIVSPNRKEKYDKRARGENAPAKRQWLPHDEWMQKKAEAKARAVAWHHFEEENDALWADQKREGKAFRAGLYKRTRQESAATRLQMRGHYKDQWRRLYASQSADKRGLDGIRHDSDAIRFINARADLLRLGIERMVADNAKASGTELTTAGFRQEVDAWLVQMKTSRRVGTLRQIVEAAHADQKEALGHNVRIAQDQASSDHWQDYMLTLHGFHARQHQQRNILRVSHGFDPKPIKPFTPRPIEPIQEMRDVRAVRIVADRAMPVITGPMVAPAPGLRPPMPGGDIQRGDLKQQADNLRRKWRQGRDSPGDGRERERPRE
jgi:hypothetical protein